jgi:transcriptional antiterminator NusG
VTDDVDDDAVDPLEEFRAALRSQPGEWYVVHSYSGMENRVKANLESRISSLNMEDYIFQVEVPTEEVAEIKAGQRKLVKRVRFPGYVLVRMELTDASWGAVRNTPAVTGFVGNAHQPQPLTLDEVEGWLAPAFEQPAAAGQRSRRGGADADRGRGLRRRRLGHGDRRAVRLPARHDQRDQHRRTEDQGPGGDLRA